MKKKYVKPELLYEQYMLNQHMASGCMFEETQGNQGDTTACKSYTGVEQTEFAGMTLFMTDAVCGENRSAVETYCYWTSTASIATVGLNGSGG